MSLLSDDDIVIRREGENNTSADAQSPKKKSSRKPPIATTPRRPETPSSTPPAQAQSTPSTGDTLEVKPLLPPVLQEHKHSIIAILLFLTGILSLLACLSYSPSDASGAGVSLKELGGLFTGDDLIRAKAETVRNWLGLTGAALSHFLFISITGYASIAYPVLLLFWSRSVLRKNDPKKLTYITVLVIAAAVITASFAGTVSRVAWLPTLPPEASGAIGMFVSGILTQLIGNIGAFLFLTAMTVIGLVISIDLDIEKSIFRLNTFISKLRDKYDAFRRRKEAEKKAAESTAPTADSTQPAQTPPPDKAVGKVNAPLPKPPVPVPSALPKMYMPPYNEEPARLLRRRSEAIGTAQDLNDILEKYARFDAEAEAASGVAQPDYENYAPLPQERIPTPENPLYEYVDPETGEAFLLTHEEHLAYEAYLSENFPEMYDDGSDEELPKMDDEDNTQPDIIPEDTQHSTSTLSHIEPFEANNVPITVELKPHAEATLPPLQTLISPSAARIAPHTPQPMYTPPPPPLPKPVENTPAPTEHIDSQATASPSSINTASNEDYMDDDGDEVEAISLHANATYTSDDFEEDEQPVELPEATKPKLLLTVKDIHREETVAAPAFAQEPPNPLDEDIRYVPPSIDLLSQHVEESSVNDDELKLNARLLKEKLLNFNIEIDDLAITPGPVVTQYEFVPAPGVKVSRIEGLGDDIALALKAKGIRIMAPVPGKGTVGVEIPNHKPEMVTFSSIVRSSKFADTKQKLPLALGKTINGEVFTVDLAKMPHLLIAGATGAGKSVGINTIIASLLFKLHPRNLKIMMFDPKKVEMSQYRALIDHFLAISPDVEEDIITTPTNAVAALNSVVLEMENRYTILSKVGQRNIADYNEKVAEGRYKDTTDIVHRQMPYLVVIIDELADLMMTAGKEVEEPITRLAQLARAVGIHLVVATQRPSVDVITGLIKANFPARIAYRVASKIDSRTILDTSGAELLLGNGDMLFQAGGAAKPLRVQNAFISTDEVEAICTHINRQQGYSEPFYLPSANSSKSSNSSNSSGSRGGSDRDELFEEAARLIVRHQQGSVSLLQRRLKVGYARAARLVDQLEEAGIVGPFDGSKARQVLLESEMELEAYL